MKAIRHMQHPSVETVPVEGTPFVECPTCYAIFDGETMISEPLSPEKNDPIMEFMDEHIIKEATEQEGGWDISTESSTGFGMSKDRTGDRVFKKGDGIQMVTFQGSRIKGVYHRPDNEGEWEKVWHNTDAEQNELHRQESIEFKRRRVTEFAEGREKLDAAYDNLPEPFQQRIGKYRTNNPSFRVEYEPYEMMCCEQAVEFAETALRKVGYEWEGVHPDPATIPEKVRDQAVEWYEWWGSLNTEKGGYKYDKQGEEMPGLDHGHSGNSFGMAYRFGGLWLVNNTEAVVGHFGAMAPLVGSDEYGDVPREEVVA